MKQIFNWTVGSFFRSIGRILAYIIIGGFIAYLIGASGFDIKSLFFTSVKADEFYTAGWFTYYSDSSNVYPLMLNGGTHQYFIPTANSQSISNHFIYFTPTQLRNNNYDYISVPFMVTGSLENEVANQNIYCSKWTYTNCSIDNDGYKNCKYECQTSTTSGVSFYDIEFSFTITIGQQYPGGNQAPCNIQGDKLICALQPNVTYDHFIISYNYTKTSQTGIYFNLGRVVGYYKNGQNAINQSINETTHAINETNQIISDTNTTSDTSDTADFFNDTNSTTAEGSLQGIISAPLSIIDNLVTDGTSTPLCFTLNSKNICLPDGSIIWDNTTISDWFSGGSKNAFISFFNLVVGGYLVYKMLMSLYRMVDDMLNPTSSRIEVMRL